MNSIGFCYFVEKICTLNTEYFIAHRLVKERSFQGLIAQRMSKIATLSIAISTAIMVIAIAIVTGFKKEIREKITGFSAPIQITNLDANASLEVSPLNSNKVPLTDIRKIPNVKGIYPYTIKPAIIKTSEEIQGIILKGVDGTYDWSFFKSKLIDGRLPNYLSSKTSNEIIISKNIASKLGIKLNDKVKTVFIQNPPRNRAFKVVGIYDSKFQEFDSKYVISDLRHTQKLNDWNSTQYAGYDVLINDFSKLNQTTLEIVELAGYKLYGDGSRLRIENIKESMANIFDWLSLQDMNALVVLVLMIFVAGINMITGILIILLDRIKMIGILKSLGMSKHSLQKVFLYLSSSIVLKGLLWGNGIGISLCLIQKYTSLVKLEEATYFLDHVPVSLELSSLFILNITTFILLAFFMLIPLTIISKISPSETIRYE